MSVDLDPWLQPIYRRLQAECAFEQLAPVSQFQRLLEAAAADAPDRASQLRTLTPADQSAPLARLSAMDRRPPAPPQTELWRVRRGERAPVCVAVSLPHGVDLRLLEGHDMRRTALIRRGSSESHSTAWRDKLLAAGWTGTATTNAKDA